ncbi:glycosyltransferase [Pontibacter akesuensis]|uniref:Glycosyltransferase involved in cell wall bisynthesis n=1 Tax=Pontibacter akesuensis TaxID=388950 RepID=A0A1I7GHE3_9BACT|nr:glycosyltransferase [Pontibacter akesuensis]GHA56817.1 hypothetical protein GCM10007389_05560 [Pontibacter akesuensis]SFU47853.1 Glycosyltransferase involved in cell wall bisynthesis [Pontibacter akesuensis]
MNFVFVSLQRINTDRDSTSTSLAKELAKSHRVLYVNSPIARGTAVKASGADKYTKAHISAIKSKKDPLSQLSENLWVLNPPSIIESLNWIPFTGIFSLANRLNNKRLADDIRSALERLGITQFILINDKDIFRSFYLKELLKPEKYIYLDRDYTIGVDYWKKHGTKLEPELMRKSDAVVCNSYDFVTRAKLYNPNSFYIGNGFNVEQYSSATERVEPEDLKAIPGPRIGYVGALLSIRLDIALMVEMAKARPAWSFVLIGPEDQDFKDSELHVLPNVYFLGKKHTSEVPAYTAHFHVCVNPQILNDITKGNFPLKVVEYLAMGRPVVATETNTMNEVFSSYAYLADSPTSFIAQIEKALLQDNGQVQQERKRFAQNFSWQKVAELLLASIAGNHTREKEAVLKKLEGPVEAYLPALSLGFSGEARKSMGLK